MNHNLDFLFLSEVDAVKAGAGDIHTCIQVMDEVFDLLGQGDYLMGAPNHNSHGIKIYFPKETPFPGMPVKGPDRRFMALVGYLGGRFHVCGEKWYGSNLANREKGLPRSILTTVLNDPDTGAPLAIMSANALSAARTGAIPAVGAKYFARNQAETVSAIGIGVIGRACLEALMDVLKSIREIRLCDIDEAAAKRYAEELREKYKVSVKVAASVEEAVRGDVRGICGGIKKCKRRLWKESERHLRIHDGSGLGWENQERGYYRSGRCGGRQSRGKTRRQGKGDFHYGWNADRGFGLGIYHLPECPGTGHWKATESLGRLDVGQKAEGRKRRGDSGP